MAKVKSLNLNMLNKLVAELNELLMNYNSKCNSLSSEDRGLELSKLVGLATTISLESNLLSQDALKLFTMNPNPVAEDNLIKYLTELGGNKSTTNN